MRLLETIYFPGPSGYNELPYRKALVYKEDVDYFLELGATTTQPDEAFEFVPEAEEAEGEMENAVDGDKGDGEPGTLEWHNTQVNAMRVKKDIVNYVSEVIGEDAEPQIDRRKSLAVIRLRAKKLIKDFMEQ